MKVLILGGTDMAYDLAARLAGMHVDVTTSLAGVTRRPRQPQGMLRVGGFGGASGLGEFLRAGSFTHLIDATHPYAAQISHNAVDAASMADVRLLRLARAPWVAPPDAVWVRKPDLTQALGFLPSAARVFATIGVKQIAALAGWNKGQMLVRVIDVPAQAMPDHLALVPGRPPFSHEAERRLMMDNHITHLLTKNSGGAASWAKITAAVELGIEIIVIDRPQLPAAPSFSNLDALVGALHAPSS